jgi:hypothetical protein
MHTLAFVTAEFLDQAPVRVTRAGVVPAPLAAVFAAYADRPEDWKLWCPGFTGGEWITPPPHEVGSVRRVRAGGRTIEEKVLVYERDRRWAFAVVGLNAPGLRALIEDYAFEELPGLRTRITWTIAVDAPGPAFGTRRAVDAAMRLLLNRAAAKLPSVLGVR